MFNSLRGLTSSDTFRSMLFAALFALTTADTSERGDWPQILGPNRDGRAVEESLTKSGARRVRNTLEIQRRKRLCRCGG